MCNCNVKPAYIMHEVQIHGLEKRYEVGEINRRVKEALQREFQLGDHDVTIDVVEHAP